MIEQKTYYIINKGVVRELGGSNYSNAAEGTSMCIYCTTTNYRRIYENHHGTIPIDSDGRTFDIHHIDGNHSNNHPDNLQAVTIQEHYDIHYARKEFSACRIMKLQRMDRTPEEISKLSTELNNKRVADGTHPFLDTEKNRQWRLQAVAEGRHHFTSEFAKEVQRKLVSDGTHHLLGGAHHQQMVKNGTHNMLGGQVQRDRVRNGTHHLLGKDHIVKMLAAGTHASQIKKECPHCNKIVSSNTYARWHGDNCKRLGGI